MVLPVTVTCDAITAWKSSERIALKVVLSWAARNLKAGRLNSFVQ
jgi:hypothetical protein